MASTNIVHVTNAGERWDTIAWNYYGNATQYSAIVMANPQVSISPTLPAGIQLIIPVIVQTVAPVTSLPPWKQQA